METRDAAALAAWFLNAVGTALLTGMVVAVALVLIGLGTDKAGWVWLAFAAGPAATGLMLLMVKAPSQSRLGETQAPTR